MEIKKLNSEEIKKLINNKTSRIGLAANDHVWFFNIYFGHYITYEAAGFHRKMFSLTEDENITTLGVIAFRGSAKSTIFTLSYPIWAILGKQQKKFVVILGETQRQAKQDLVNIKKELESNNLLKTDLGPFKEVEDEWGSYSLVIPKYNARITAASMEQTIRGMRHNQYRPDLIIADDIEDLNNVKTKEGRDKVYEWVTGEIVPAGDHNTRIIFIGNLLHRDSLLMRIKDKIQNKELDGYFIEIPLIDGKDNITWPGKFPDMKSVEKEKRKVGNEIAWQREYMLNIVSDEGRVIHPEWIHYYDNIRENPKNLRFILTGVDPAISKKESADYTALVSAKVYGYEENMRVYILPNPINKRMDFPETVSQLKQLFKTLKSRILVESVSYQKSLSEQLTKDGIPAEDVSINGQDKRARLAMISHLIQSGKILFPRHGAEELISQMVNFGIEKHDDLADALTLLAFKAIEESEEPDTPEIFSIAYKPQGMNRGLSDDDYDDDL